MANVRATLFVTEVAPPKVISIVKRKVLKVLETIAEEEKEATESFSSSARPASSCFVRMKKLGKPFLSHGQGLPRPVH